MINKKTINKIKTENFLKKFPIFFVVQHNSFTVNDWLEWRQKIQSSCLMSDRALVLGNENQLNQQVSEIEILNIKNSLLKKIVEASNASPKSKSVSFDSVFQGPLFLIGCKNDDHLNWLWDSLKLNPKLIFICCIYKNQLLNHLDLEILLKTNFSVYHNLLASLDKKTEFFNTLYSSLPNQPLNLLQYNILTHLSMLK
jgi:hypothetical protein